MYDLHLCLHTRVACTYACTCVCINVCMYARIHSVCEKKSEQQRKCVGVWVYVCISTCKCVLVQIHADIHRYPSTPPYMMVRGTMNMRMDCIYIYKNTPPPPLTPPLQHHPPTYSPAHSHIPPNNITIVSHTCARPYVHVISVSACHIHVHVRTYHIHVHVRTCTCM